jgi:hypothetical protein
VLSGFDECSKCGWSTSAYAKQLRQRRGMCGRGGLADPRLTERVSTDGSHWPGCSSSASSAVRWWGSSSANPASNAVAAAVNTNGPAVGLQFISGTHVPLVALPTRMSVAGSVFPVKWMAQGFRSVLLPEQMVAFEPAGTWELGRIFLVLAAWSVGGLLACLAVFRSSDKN